MQTVSPWELLMHGSSGVLLPGTQTSKHMQPGTDVGKRAVDKAACTTQSRHESGHGGAASLTSAIKNAHFDGLTCPSKETEASPEDPLYPVSITQGVIYLCEGSLSFLLALEGPQGLLYPAQ